MRHNYFFTAFAALSLFFVVSYTACIKDKCGTVICDNGGVCVQGKCACPTGYEGGFCQKQWNEKFEGNWNASDSMNRVGTRINYPVVIDGGATKDSFYVYGFMDTVDALLCTRTAPLKFSFQADRKVDSFVTIKSGNGVVDSLTGNITGIYSIQKKLATKDTIMTVYFSWKR